MESVGTHLWPAQGDYYIYDELLYYAMTSDKVRNDSYKRAMRQRLSGKTVVDIGTGADICLTRFCIEAGAKKVYAIELSEEAFRSATRNVHQLKLADRVQLIRGNSFQVALPEKVDYCVSELIGTIGSSEGGLAILSAARRFLKPEGQFIPRRVFTMIAAVSLPEFLRAQPFMSEVPAYYTEMIFAQRGYPFDLRLCITNFPSEQIFSTSEICEDIDFQDMDSFTPSRNLELVITKSGAMQGFLLWVCVETTPNDVIDTLNCSGCWSPAFFPAFYPGFEVSEGDVIEISFKTIFSNTNSDFKPDYYIEGQVSRANVVLGTFSYSSPLDERRFRSSPFYERLLTTDGHPSSKPMD
jgi:precorrin-6B methylase 2